MSCFPFRGLETETQRKSVRYKSHSRTVLRINSIIEDTFGFSEDTSLTQRRPRVRHYGTMSNVTNTTGTSDDSEDDLTGVYIAAAGAVVFVCLFTVCLLWVTRDETNKVAPAPEGDVESGTEPKLKKKEPKEEMGGGSFRFSWWFM